MYGKCFARISIALVAICLGLLPAWAQLPPPPTKQSMADVYTGKSYSPYAGRGFPSQVYWGDSHLHTAMSFDAGAFGNRLGIAEAYQFARGDEVVSSIGIPAKLSRPLDWLMVADHSDNMGFFSDLLVGKQHLLSDPTGKDWYDRIQAGEGVDVALEIIGLFSQGKFPESLRYSPDTIPYKSAWQHTIKTAEQYNDPGKFTAFIGFEWTSLIKGNNLHRVVMYRDGADKASQMVAYTTIPPLGSPNPRDLWKWMSTYEEKTGGDVLAIAHNGNLSNGIMFPLSEQYDGKSLNKTYVSERAKWEPAYEVTQIKGDGETHPYLSPEDEFADYETWDVGNLDVSVAKTDDMLAGEYAREALKRGLMLEAKLGTNPYKFGMVGATDSHTGLTTAEEENYFGKSVSVEPSKSRIGHPFIKSKLGEIKGYLPVASGYQGVWATENTRKAIFDAMLRKETYATTGPRIPVRFFGGWEYNEDDLRSRAPAFRGYEKGVPMGGDLPPAAEGKKAPTFMAYALRDPVGANLDRIQVIKGWLDKDGKTQERIYDVAVSGGRKIDADGRCRTPVGNTVDVEAANWTNTIGASELAAVWADPDFDPKQSAFYYARVIEIPTPRWVLYDKLRFGAEIPKEAETIGQERAYTSPIWYNPS